MTSEPRRVTDAADPRLADYRDLTDVRLRKLVEPEQGLFIAEGEKVIRRAVDAGYRPRSFLMADRWLDRLDDVVSATDAPVYTGDESVLESVTGYRVHRGALAAMHRRPLPPASEVLAGARRVVLLEGVVDHTNVGAVFRSVAAMGFDAVLVDPTCADPLYRRSVRVSMGTVFAVPWTRLAPWPSALAALRTQGFTVAALTPGPDAVPLDEVAAAPPERLVLALGTEGEGLSPAALGHCTLAVRIPMADGVDSLNVAAASAVACYALRLSDRGISDRGISDRGRGARRTS
jgi:tRNA G18 (ribose-2'-O)-methylase SpoU